MKEDYVAIGILSEDELTGVRLNFSEIEYS